MNRIAKRGAALLLMLGVLVTLLVLPGAAAGTYTLPVPVRYGQTEARTVTELVNRHRSKKLSYDYALEACAMLRAAEAAVCQSHTRPDGSPFHTVLQTRGARAECLAYGTVTARSVVNQFLDSTYGHRDILLDSRYRAVGAGHVCVDGRHFWSLIFSSEPSGAKAVPAKDCAATVAVRVSPAKVQTRAALSKSRLTLSRGQQTELPTAKLTVIGKYYDLTFPVQAKWKSGSASVLSISGTQAKAVAMGSTTAQATLPGGQVLTLPVTVQRDDLRNAAVTLSTTSVAYTGTARRPGVTVKLSGRTLSSGRDYTVTYQNNVAPGTGRVIVKGCGGTTGSVTKTFQIQTARPNLKKAENMDGGVKLTWSAVPGARAYRVYYRTGSGAWKKAGDTTGTTLTWKGAVSGVRYTFSLCAIDGVGSNTAISSRSGSVSLLYLAPPQVKSLKSGAARTFTAVWNRVSGVTGYQIQYSTNRKFTGCVTVTVTDALSYKASGLRSGQTYYVRLRTYAWVNGGAKLSAWGKTRTVKLK